MGIDSNKFFGKGGSYTSRKLHYLCNTPLSIMDKEELIYMLIYHDYSKTLIKKYGYLLSKQDKENWLKEKRSLKYQNFPNAQFWNELYYYVLFPDTPHPDLHVPSIQYQMLLYLEAINHKHLKVRNKAILVIEIITPYLKDMDRSFKYRLLEALVVKVNRENIKWIDRLIYKNISSIHTNNLNSYLSKSLELGLMSSKSSLKYLKYSNLMSAELANKLKNTALVSFSNKIVFDKLI